MIKVIDSIVSVLSLHITNPDDLANYENSYGEIRDALYTNNTDINSFEPLKTNRFICVLPEFFQINNWRTAGVSLPQMKRNFFGRVKWSNMKILIHEVVGRTAACQILSWHKDKRNYDIIFQALDPTGFVVHEITITIDRAIGLKFNEYSYKCTDKSKTEVEFSVKNLIVNY